MNLPLIPYICHFRTLKIADIDVQLMATFLSKQSSKELKAVARRDPGSLWGSCATYLALSNTTTTRNFLYLMYKKDRGGVKTLQCEQRLHCICRQKADPQKPMIQCRQCEEQYHYSCVGYDTTTARDYDCALCLNGVCNDASSNQVQTKGCKSANALPEVKTNLHLKLEDATTRDDELQVISGVLKSGGGVVDCCSDSEMAEKTENGIDPGKKSKRYNTRSGHRKMITDVLSSDQTSSTAASTSTIERHDKELKEKCYCICRRPNDPKRPMVECATCGEWYHFTCVGYKPTPRKNKVDYTCKLCIQNIDKNTVSPPNDIQTGSYEPLGLSCSSKIVKNGETSIKANETNKNKPINICTVFKDTTCISPHDDIHQTGRYEPLDLPYSSKIVTVGETSLKANATNKNQQIDINTNNNTHFSTGNDTPVKALTNNEAIKDVVIGVLRKLKHIFPQHILRLLYNSLIHPYLTSIYSLNLWGFKHKRITILQKKTLRIPYISHSTPPFKELKIPMLKDLYTIQLYKTYYKNIQ